MVDSNGSSKPAPVASAAHLTSVVCGAQSPPAKGPTRTSAALGDDLPELKRMVAQLRDVTSHLRDLSDPEVPSLAPRSGKQHFSFTHGDVAFLLGENATANTVGKWTKAACIDRDPLLFDPNSRLFSGLGLMAVRAERERSRRLKMKARYYP